MGHPVGVCRYRALNTKSYVRQRLSSSHVEPRRYLVWPLFVRRWTPGHGPRPVTRGRGWAEVCRTTDERVSRRCRRGGRTEGAEGGDVVSCHRGQWPPRAAPVTHLPHLCCKPITGGGNWRRIGGKRDSPPHDRITPGAKEPGRVWRDCHLGSVACVIMCFVKTSCGWPCIRKHIDDALPVISY